MKEKSDFRRTPPKRVLVVSTLRIGDVLLTTPLIRSLKHAWPSALVDVVVLNGSEGVLAGNTDINNIITVPLRSTLGEKLAFAIHLWNRYDLAVSTVASDRARIYCWVAARWRAGFLNPTLKDRPKGLLLNDWRIADDLGTHAVEIALSLADRLDVPRIPEVVVPTAEGTLPPEVKEPFAVLHPYPKFNYKKWIEAGWVALGKTLQERGLALVLTGGNDPDELAYCARVAAASGAINLAGKLSLGQTSDLLKKAQLFVGPDTAITHIAAATGIPTVALFGPSNPVKWGPRPSQWTSKESPWLKDGNGQQGNVFLLQGDGECVPCHLEGCARQTSSFSNCLQEMSEDRVIAAALAMLPTATS